MTLALSLLLKADAGQATAALKAVKGDLAGVQTAAVGMSSGTNTASTSVKTLTTAADSAAAELTQLASAESRAATTAGQLRTAHQGAAGSVGNLVSQFNDIGMMIAAGQNPLQLAIQQGSQITQVIGPMGAGGAVKALGGALVGMLNPVNLVTYAVIAGGAAFVQAFFAGGEEVISMGDAIDDLATKIADLRKGGVADIDALRKAYGEVNAGVLDVEDALRRLETVKVFQAQTAAIKALKAETEGSWFAAFTDDRFTQGGQIADLLNSDWLVNGKLVATDAVNTFRDTLNSLDTAKGPSAQIAVFQSLQNQILQATGGIDLMTASQLEFYQNLVLSEQQLRQFKQVQLESAQAAEKAARAAGTDNGRMGGPMASDYKPADENVAADLTAANEMLATLQQQADVRATAAQYGHDSAQVALEALEAERAKNAEMVQGLDISESLKAELIAAWDAANGIGSARIKAMLEAALGPASQLAQLMAQAASSFGSLPSMNGALKKFSSGANAVADWWGGLDDSALAPKTSPRPKPAPPLLGETGTVAGRTRSAAGARAERDAVAELIAKLEDEAAIQRELDPVKAEMLKHRKDLATATTEERARVEELIRAEQQLKAVEELNDFLNTSSMDLLKGLAAGGDEATNAMKRLGSAILDAAMQALLLGKGPLAGILGISGGLFSSGGASATGTGSLGLPMPFADGGMIFGAGGPRDDKIPMWGSAGEYMVNARATAKYKPLLDRINYGGDIPGFANGGMVGGGKGGGGLGRAERALEVHNHIYSPTGNTEIHELVLRATKAGIEEYDREAMPYRVKDIVNHQRKVG